MAINQKEMGQRIASLRKENQLTQEKLAEKLHISLVHYSKIESGSHGLSVDLLVEIAETFDVTTDYILLGKIGKSPILKSTLKNIIHNLSEIEKLL